MIDRMEEIENVTAAIDVTCQSRLVKMEKVMFAL